MPRLLMVAGTQPTASDLHLLYLRAFEKIGFEATLLAHDSGLPFAEKVLQQARRQFSAAHFSHSGVIAFDVLVVLSAQTVSVDAPPAAPPPVAAAVSLAAAVPAADVAALVVPDVLLPLLHALITSGTAARARPTLSIRRI